MAKRLLIRAQRGVSLIEVLVGIAIGMVGILVVFQVFAINESQKRTISGSADAQTNGALALYAIENDIRVAGLGFASTTTFFGCNTRVHDEGRPSGTRDYTLPLEPVLITHGAAGAPDSITIMYGNPELVAPSETFSQVSASQNYQVTNRAGYRAGDLLVAAQSGVDCSLVEVTGTPSTAGQTSWLVHDNGATYTAPSGSSASARFNKSGGTGVTYASGTLFNLGQAPQFNTYLISNDRLVMRDALRYTDSDGDGANDTTGLGDAIVQMQAQYGIDSNNDGKVDPAEFTDTAPATATEWSRLRAIRIALLARSGQYEKTTVTSGTPAWAGGNFIMSNPADGTDWHNYRYRVYQTVIPLRNMIWGQS